MKLVSWNVNGIRACLKRGFMDFFEKEDADIFFLQETKIQEEQIPFHLENYHQFWNFAKRKGYAGTAVFSKEKPISALYGIGLEEHDAEGRVITLEFDDLYVMTVYAPNSQRGLTRLDYRMKWEKDFLLYLEELRRDKPVVFGGDLNVAHNEIDLRNPKSNQKNAGFTPDERARFTKLLDSGFIDTFRHFYPDKAGAYTWWSYMFNARANNIGWRVDYFCVSSELEGRLKSAVIYDNITGSDHCPVGLELKQNS